jgi:hypothetical protein
VPMIMQQQILSRYPNTDLKEGNDGTCGRERKGPNWGGA